MAQGALGLVAGWAGQSGVFLCLGVVIAVAAPAFLGHLPSISQLGVNGIIGFVIARDLTSLIFTQV